MGATLWISVALVASAVACRATPTAGPAPSSPAAAAPMSPAPAPVSTVTAPLEPRATNAPAAEVLEPSRASSQCVSADWSPRQLGPLLKPGQSAKASQRDRPAAAPLIFAPDCSDVPGWPVKRTPHTLVVEGVELRVASVTRAGKSGRGWPGNQCTFDIRLADGTGQPVHLGPQDVPPFTTITALIRARSAAWLSVGFNGYTREFPKGGNRVIAVDLCDGRVVWQSKNSMSNGGLLLLDDYLISPYGFTSERRYAFVLDARSGNIVQKLPIIENICPSKSWAPHWHAGDRCDAPGQAVGAATSPRIEAGVFLVDTNTGSSSFELN